MKVLELVFDICMNKSENPEKVHEKMKKFLESLDLHDLSSYQEYSNFSTEYEIQNRKVIQIRMDVKMNDEVNPDSILEKMNKFLLLNALENLSTYQDFKDFTSDYKEESEPF